MKYPIGIQSFDRIIEDGYVYIDKTDMVYSFSRQEGTFQGTEDRQPGKILEGLSCVPYGF